jgi:hypothetical protein
MGTQPQPFERMPESQPENYGPPAPRIENEKIISSGPLGSSLRGSQGKEIKIPEEKKEFLGQLKRRLPEPHLTTVLNFLRTIENEKREEAAELILGYLKELPGQRLDRTDNPSEVLEKYLNEVEEQIGRTIQ